MNLSTNDRTSGGTYIENGSGGKFFFAVFGFRFYKTTQFMGMALEGCSFSVDDVETVTACIGCITEDCYCGIVEDMVKKLANYEDLEEQEKLVKLPCKVGDTVYVDATILPVENMECYEDVDREVPAYFQARVVSFRFAKRNWMKIAVREKWLYEWIDDETGPDSNYIECEKNFTISLSNIGKTVFLTKSEAEEKLKELRGNNE